MYLFKKEGLDRHAKSLLRLIKSHRMLTVFVTLALALAIALPMVLLGIGPTRADPDIIIHHPGDTIDISDMEFETPMFCSYYDLAWHPYEQGGGSSLTPTTLQELNLWITARNWGSEDQYYDWLDDWNAGVYDNGSGYDNIYGTYDDFDKFIFRWQLNGNDFDWIVSYYWDSGMHTSYGTFNNVYEFIIWGWYGSGGGDQNTAGKYNEGTKTVPAGVATPDHVLFFPADHEAAPPKPSKLLFAGYWSAPHFDCVFTEDYDLAEIDFDFQPAMWDTHTFRRTGFFIKSVKNPDGTITGYMISIGSNGTGIDNGYNPYTYDLYYVENMDIELYNQQIETASSYSLQPFTSYYPYAPSGDMSPYFNYNTGMVSWDSSNRGFPGNASNTTIVTLLDSSSLPALSTSSPKMHLRTVMTGDTITFYITPNSTGPSPAEQQVLTYTLPSGTFSGDGFGPWCQYTCHACSSLTRMEYSDFTVTLNNPPIPNEARVKFWNMNDNASLGADYVYPEEMWPSDTYDVLPPNPITVGGVDYYFFKADREVLLDIPVEEDDAYNITDLYYVEAPTIRKDARIPGIDSVIHNGSISKPYIFPENEQIEYTITVTNPNVVELDEPFVVQDSLPVGLAYVSHSQSAGLPTGVMDVFGGQDRVTWTLPSGLPEYDPLVPGSGILTFTIVAEVTWPSKVLENWAILIPPPDTGLEITNSNHTYHKSTPRPVEGSKEAQVGSSPTGPWEDVDNGDPDPVEFDREDYIKYTIHAESPNASQQINQYDVVYAVDWSGSMSSYRTTAKDVAMELSTLIINSYPGSRIALMGDNCVNNLTGKRADLYLEVETDFCDTAAQYNSILSTAYPTSTYAHAQDDCGLFLRAAIEKLNGPILDNCGLTEAYTGTGLTVYGANAAASMPKRNATVMERDDKSRIPVILLVSDWQLFDSGYPTPYAQARVKALAQRFHQLCPTGIFIPVHMTNATPNPTGITMLNEFAAIGEGDWAYVNAGTASSSNAAEMVLETFKSLAPLTEYSGSVKDALPPGLEIVSVNPPVADPLTDVTYDPLTDQWTVEWKFDVFPDGDTDYEIVCRVRDGGGVPRAYDNIAVISTEFQTPYETNETHHKLKELILHVRQVIINPVSGLTRPVMGYYTLLNDGKTLPLTSDSVTPGYPFTEHKLIPDNDTVYIVTDIVPQYYEFAGHCQNDGANAVGHPTASPWSDIETATANGNITLDYTLTGEIWVTMYITPKGRPMNHQTGVETNNFDTVYLAP